MGTKNLLKCKNKCFLIVFFLFVLSYSCVKDQPDVQNFGSINLSFNRKVYITNEGNFMYNNSSVSFYNPDTKLVVEDIFKTQNPNQTLGDVCQSIQKVGNSFYLVVNNSNKIVLVNADDFKYQQSITGFVSPRYILPVSFSKGYVSDLYANKIAVVNLSTKNIVSYILCPGWTEKMLQFYNKVFVTNLYKNYLYVIDVLSDAIIDSIYVGKYASGIVLDKNDNLWVLSSGETSSNQLPKLHKINPVTHQILNSFVFNSSDHPRNLIIDAARENLYFINQHIYKMNISATQLPTQPFITSQNNNFYSMEWNFVLNELYVSDAMDYVQKSTIYRYDNSGKLIHTFKAGINASGFWME